MSGMQRMRGRNYWRHEGNCASLTNDSDVDPRFAWMLAIGLFIIGLIAYFIIDYRHQAHIDSLKYSDYQDKTVYQFRSGLGFDSGDQIVIVKKYLSSHGVIISEDHALRFLRCLEIFDSDANQGAPLNVLMPICKDQYEHHSSLFTSRF